MIRHKVMLGLSENEGSGERERRVQASLLTRPAGVLAGADSEAIECLRGMSQGSARTRGHFNRLDRLVIGSPAMERDWRRTWSALESLGLVHMRIVETPCDRDGWSGVAKYRVTALGEAVWLDYLEWERELDDAIAVDEEIDDATYQDGPRLTRRG